MYLCVSARGWSSRHPALFTPVLYVGACLFERLIASAEANATRDDYHGALAALDEALRLIPGHHQGQELRRRYQATLEHQEAERRRAAAVAAITAQLDGDDLEAAGRLLDAAVAEHGESDDLARLTQRLEELDRCRRQAAARKLLDQARSQLAVDEASGAVGRIGVGTDDVSARIGLVFDTRDREAATQRGVLVEAIHTRADADVLGGVHRGWNVATTIGSSGLASWLGSTVSVMPVVVTCAVYGSGTGGPLCGANKGDLSAPASRMLGFSPNSARRPVTSSDRLSPRATVRTG